MMLIAQSGVSTLGTQISRRLRNVSMSREPCLGSSYSCEDDSDGLWCCLLTNALEKTVTVKYVRQGNCGAWFDNEPSPFQDLNKCEMYLVLADPESVPDVMRITKIFLMLISIGERRPSADLNGVAIFSSLPQIYVHS